MNPLAAIRRLSGPLVLAACLVASIPAVAQDAAAPAPTPTPMETPAAAPTAQPPASQEPAAPLNVQAPSVAGDGQQALPPPPEPPAAVEPVVQQDAGPAPILPHNLSPWGMFMAADIVVKAVMIGLAFASLVTWTVWLAKSLEIAAAKAAARRALRVLVKSSSLYDATRAENVRGFGARLMQAAAHEMDRSEGLPADGIKERAVASLTRIEARAARSVTRGMGVLATIGATAPFVGLFGTVWGIMNSFIGIAAAQTTNLAVVAPGIAEALLATAIGLVAAIPAVVIYNVFTRSIAGYRAILADASAEIMKHVSRDLDRYGMTRHLRAAE